jgi:hypothetical protein
MRRLWELWELLPPGCMLVLVLLVLLVVLVLLVLVLVLVLVLLRRLVEMLVLILPVPLLLSCHASICDCEPPQELVNIRLQCRERQGGQVSTYCGHEWGPTEVEAVSECLCYRRAVVLTSLAVCTALASLLLCSCLAFAAIGRMCVSRYALLHSLSQTCLATHRIQAFVFVEIHEEHFAKHISADAWPKHAVLHRQLVEQAPQVCYLQTAIQQILDHLFSILRA